jgi:hypothetical protein
MEIYFLTPEEAYPRLQNVHINTGSGSDKSCTRTHHHSIIAFTSTQRSLLAHFMKKLETSLEPYRSEVGKIDFVLLESGVYWDFPFTWGETIICLTPKFFTMSYKEILTILTHEWIHLEQRRYGQKYELYYRNLGFRKAQIDFGALGPYILRNPDADNYEWIWQTDPTSPVYAPVALLHQCQFSTVLLEFKDIVKGEVVLHKTENVPAYHRHFGTKRQLYHPNEIVAHLIADYLVDGYRHRQIDYDILIGLLVKK